MSGVHRGIALPETESLFGGGVLGGLPDRDLLERFSANRDAVGELAFTALVARHGPMVLVVCRRMLRDPSDVDDAFQATFLVLARKAGSIRVADSLGPWLYGVSTRVARRLQGAASRRRTQCADEEWLQSVPDRRADRMSDLDRRWEIDETLATLPDAFRAALRLCYFEGLTHEEAAARLGCPVGTVRSRMARGRALLRRRLEDAPASRSTGVSAGPWEIGTHGSGRGASRGGRPAGRSGTGPRRYHCHGSA
jgi:RNA polymerase sigma-70 factor (ECF subfamily)